MLNLYYLKVMKWFSQYIWLNNRFTRLTFKTRFVPWWTTSSDFFCWIDRLLTSWTFFSSTTTPLRHCEIERSIWKERSTNGSGKKDKCFMHIDRSLFFFFLYIAKGARMSLILLCRRERRRRRNNRNHPRRQIRMMRDKHRLMNKSLSSDDMIDWNKF